MHRFRNTFRGCTRGSAAVEFALVVPVLISMTVGTIYAGLVIYSAMGLQNAVEVSARCFAVSSQCATASAAQDYAKKIYNGLATPTFVASTVACGHQVTGSVNVKIITGINAIAVPVSAKACYF
jgi:Flp pilus assembly protein TadG